MSAEALGSVMPSDSAASARARTAVTSPGSALAASWAATSTGSAPSARRTSAASRSSARRTASGTALRTASRARSCWKARRPPASMKIPASMTSRTGSTRSATGMRAIAAIWLSVNWRPREAATVTTRSPAGVVRDRRRRMLSSSRCGTRFSTNLARPSATETRFSSRRPARRSTMRKGLPCTPARVRRRSPPAGAPSTSAATSATAEAFSGVRWIVAAPAVVSSASARRICGTPWFGRTAISHATGNDASHCVSMRRAKPHPASAHCTSSRHTSSGCRSAARSSRVCISWRSQNGSSRERSRDPSAVRSTSDSAPPNSASMSTASSTELWPGSAAPSPVRNESVRAVARAAASSLVLPRPAAPSMIATPPTPARTRSRKPVIICNCSSRPRIGDELPVPLTIEPPAPGRLSSGDHRELPRPGAPRSCVHRRTTNIFVA